MSDVRKVTLSAFALVCSTALLLAGCANMDHMKKSDIPTDQNPAHDMHKTPGT